MMFVILVTIFSGLGGPVDKISSQSVILPGVYADYGTCQSKLWLATDKFFENKKTGDEMLIKCVAVKGSIGGHTSI